MCHSPTWTVKSEGLPFQMMLKVKVFSFSAISWHKSLVLTSLNQNSYLKKFFEGLINLSIYCWTNNCFLVLFRIFSQLMWILLVLAFTPNALPGVGLLVKPWELRVCSSQGLGFESHQMPAIPVMGQSILWL